MRLPDKLFKTHYLGTHLSELSIYSKLHKILRLVFTLSQLLDVVKRSAQNKFDLQVLL